MSECIIDRREGSKELVSPLRKLGVNCELSTLDYGDVSIVGNGPGGCPVAVGVEYKTISDVLKCITDGRFSGHQLPGMLTAYQYPWLLVEGAYRPDLHSGVLQIRAHRGYWHDANIGGRKYMYRDFQAWLNTMDLRGGVRVVRTYDRTETTFWIAAMYHWWTDKEYEEHKSHLAQHEDMEGRSTLVKPSVMRRVAAQLPGIGWDKSGNACRHFASIKQMINASEKEWEKVDGVGKTLSKRIVKEVGV